MMDACDLETAIADIRHLAFACCEIAESKLKHAKSLRRTEGFHQIMLNDSELNCLLFMIGEVEHKTRKLDLQFHAALDGTE